MRRKTPRLLPLADGDIPPAAEEVLAPMRRNGNVYNIFRTLAHYPDLFRRWLPFANHVLYKSALPARERELLILRIGWLCRSGYEFNQHVVIGKAAGLSDDDIERLKIGPAAAGWSTADRSLLAATDELWRDADVGDDTWRALAQAFRPEQLIDIVFTVGQYNSGARSAGDALVSMMALNTLGVQLDPGLPQHAV